MPRTPRKPAESIGPQASNQTVQARPITSIEPLKPKPQGRPAKLGLPEFPEMPMSEAEQSMFNFFIAAYNEQFPDLTAVDQLTLFLAGVEFIKYLRVAREELETGKVITMSRQHPGVNMRALLDQLSVTRKARTARGQKEEDPEARELREFFMQKPQRRQ